MEKYNVIGLMSGTSLDGLDIALCTFIKEEEGWKYEITSAKTVKYPSRWLTALRSVDKNSGNDLIALDVAYGKLIGELTRDFITKNKLKPDFIASHGHTVFHQPSKGFTYQIGNGNAIHAVTGLPVVFDFRTLDVILGGEGAPLVPIGDKLLFNEYDVCLNLGGIANLSADVKGKRTAYDVCFTNMAFNYLASKAGKSFDKNGALAQKGEVNRILLKKLDTIYGGLKKKRPSLGREIFEKKIQPLLDDKKIPLNDKLRTFVESSAKEIVSSIIEISKNSKVLCTGGGAFNSFLMTQMLEQAADEATFIIPDDNIVKFKEALVFAFLGVLRVRDEINCLKSVTGASRDSSSGILVGF